MSAEPRDQTSYLIFNAASNNVLDLDDGSSSNGAKIQGWGQAWITGKVENQIWKLEADGDHFRIRNESSFTYMDFNDGNKGNGTKIQGWSLSKSAAAQLWKFENVGGTVVPMFRIQNKASGTYMDLDNGSPKDGTKVQGWQKQEVPAQKWILMEVDK